MENDYLLHKWLNHEASEKELNQLKSSPEYASYIKISESASGLEAPDWNGDANYEAIISKRKNNVKVRRINPLGNLLKIAALIAVILAGYLYVGSLDSKVQTQIAEKQTFLLPDDSEVAINANSTIRYNKTKWNDHRELTLDGEAYFKVIKGSRFSVKTPSGIVSVLGTQFNVYARNDLFHISCYEGLVSVAFNETIIKLPAGSYLQIENDMLTNHAATNKSSPNWALGESSFSNAPIKLVLEELQRQYPIKLTANYSNTNLRFTGNFTHGNLDLALKSICDPLRLAYTIEKESVTIYAQKVQ
jgi:ferric-dicitrate binding protein FerR (iron transport regulator)